METLVKRDYKNSVFIDMFGREEYQLEMFRTLHPEMTDITAKDITTITLRQVIINHPYNDLAFLVRDRLMIFVEAQSTWSVNILIRTLLYYADTVQEYIHDSVLDIHSTGKLSLPTPEFYVIYTGTQMVPGEVSLRRDFFNNDNTSIDLTAKVITAQTDDIIGQYIIFCRVLDDQVRKLGRTKDAAREAINICKNRGVLTRYLDEQEKEVIDIMMLLFNQEYAVEQYVKSQNKIAHEEGREEGTLKTLIQLVQEGFITEEIAAAKAAMSVKEFDAVCRLRE